MGALAVALVVTLAMIRHKARWMELTLAVTLLLTYPASVLAHWSAGDLNLFNGLPLQLCDVAALAGAVALWKRRPLACELVYFFGLAGTLQGLLTPALQEDFPSPRFIVFFVNHCGIVITAFYVVLGMGFRPRPWAPMRMMAWILSYALIVGGINGLLRTNYGFLCRKPPSTSLLDVLGPWPWYIGCLILLASLFFVVLDLPFAAGRRKQPQ